MAAISHHARGEGPDVIVGAITDVVRWARIGDITAYSVGTIACNAGTVPLHWYGNTNQHPVIAQNLYRYRDGRFEQIGKSWIKHGFAAETGTYCSLCTDPDSGSLLGVGCSDAYRAPLNGRQASLTPRSLVNPATGYFAFPIQQPPPNTELDRRMQVHDDDLIATPGADAFYFLEAIYVAADDAASGNNMNNASYRPALVQESPPGSREFVISPFDLTVQGRSGLEAWYDLDPNAISMTNIDVPGDGRIQIAASAASMENGFWRYEYAISNLNSERGVHAFSVALPPDAVIGMTRFHDVDSHSGDPMSSDDWKVDLTPGLVSWTTTPYTENPNGNAIRWGTLYNFTIDVNSPPVTDCAVALSLFKPGVPESIPKSFLGPSPLSPDCNSNGISDAKELASGAQPDCNQNGLIDDCEMILCPGIVAGDFDCDGWVTETDVAPFVAALLNAESACYADITRDRTIDGRDMQPFVDLLLAP
ncbi:MAG: hypothetical protein HZA51_04205 [Planctomycetes bacterium]|nr:hypothetical protein [Planctomycetota bacterium]